MNICKHLLLAGGLVAVMSAMPSVCKADTYATNDSDNPIRCASYYFHAYGKAWEYCVTRPVHAVVSTPKLRYIFGHVSHPRTDDYWGDFDLYQRYSY